MQQDLNKPVFESFDEFVQYVYEGKINEGLEIKDFAELKTALSSAGIDKLGNKAIAAVEEIMKKGLSSDDFNRESNLIAISRTLSVLQKADKTEIIEIKTDEDKLEYVNMLGGNVLDSSGKRVPMQTLFAEVNRKNLSSGTKSPFYDSEKKGFMNLEKTDYVKGSGALSQTILVDSKVKFDFKYNMASDMVKNPVAPSSYLDPIEGQRKGVKTTNSTFALYVPLDIKPQQGAEYNAKDISIYEIPKSTTSYKLAPIVIQDNNTLFDVNKSILKESGKQAIIAALSNVASAKKIVVTGGASQEGPKERNEELCKERAQAVVDFLKEKVFSKADEIVISDKMDIQPKESTEDRKTWRRVTLSIDGEYNVPVQKTETEIVYQADETTKKCDKLIFAQYLINIRGQVIA